MHSLLDLCILAIDNVDNAAEILTFLQDINPNFEKKIHTVLAKETLLLTIGEQKKWYKSGELRIHKVKINTDSTDSTGKIINYTKFFKNGKIYQQYTKCDGKKDGVFAEFFANGKQRHEYFNENGINTKYTLWQANGYKLRHWAKINDEGLHTEELYHRNGLIASLEFAYWKRLIKACKHGIQIYWDNEGTITNTEIWDNGRKTELALL
ncbi:MORN repeat protein [Pacmanvirus A23]|uniref:MORN repeat protein n=1 Tax=Pacmanvirus A23 TaxID=1932881 RepID=UPI000A095AF5|nr:MORN repeat protein [Pacmanvirus A23]SIP85996.1 MORN repeat protein [Pacmanvirus A23]